jgi:hypothetical protein
LEEKSRVSVLTEVVSIEGGPFLAGRIMMLAKGMFDCWSLFLDLRSRKNPLATVARDGSSG